MAYYPTFQPYCYQDQLNQLRNANPMQTQMPMQGFQMPMTMNRPDQTGLNWVQGEAGAKSWIVTPGSTVLLMDSEAQRFYLKSADANGVPAMRVFEYSEVAPTRPTQPAQAPQFVTVDEFNAFRAEIVSKLEKPANEKGEANE
jgi:hypothetical protein